MADQAPFIYPATPLRFEFRTQLILAKFDVPDKILLCGVTL
jgi:hypothetical protein